MLGQSPVSGSAISALPAVSAAVITAVFSATAAGSFNAPGASSAEAAWAASATGSLTGDGIALAIGVWATSGAAVVTWDGPSVATATMAATGAGVFTGAASATAHSTWSALGSGTVAWPAMATTVSVLNATGSGAFNATNSALSVATWAALGTGTLDGRASSVVTASFAFAGNGLLQFYSVSPTPSSRVAVVPLISRSLLLKRESRDQFVPVQSREASPFAVPRIVVVPRYPRIDMPLTWASKDPDELLDYSLNWSQALAGDTIVNSDWDINGDGLVENHSTNTSTATVIWLEDGTLNQSYTVTNTIETAGGRTFQQSVNIRILSN